MATRFFSLILLATLAYTTAPSRTVAEDTPQVVCHVKVVSDKVQDVSSLDAWKKSFIKDGMSDADKALAIWKSMVTFTFDCPPPAEFLHDENAVRDPIKAFNVYGYGLCSDLAGQEEALGRYAGLQARGWALTGHSVPELFYDNAWHLLDPAYINYWPKGDGKLAGIEEMGGEIKTFMAAHPELKDEKSLREFSKNNGWKKGPDALAHCPVANTDGIWPEGWHGWWFFMHVLHPDTKKFVYEYGEVIGYELNIQLRPGEKLTRNWSHQNLHVNMDGSGEKPNTEAVGTGALAFSPAYGDLTTCRLGNGKLEYNVPLAQVKGSAAVYENLAARGTVLTLADDAKPGVLVLRMPCSYVYLTGELSVKAMVGSGGEIAAEVSTNNGLDWKPAGEKVTASGETKFNLNALLLRHYDYRVRFTLKGSGTVLEGIRLTHDIQHSQRALPALGAGENTIRFSAGPQESTVTYEGSMNPDNKAKQTTFAELHPILNGLDARNLMAPTGKGEATIPISTPGDITRLRFGFNWRARGAGDTYDVQVSFDDGKTFKPVRKLEGPVVAMSAYSVFSDVPAGTRSALVKLSAHQVNTLMLFGLRIDADYKQPNSGFRPVKITYNWEENGQAKQDVHIAKSADETYTIKCATKPAMKSIVLELAE